MIRRELADGTLLLIPQEHHADVAAQFAAHWGGGRFATPRPYQSVVFATIYHDSGHREVEADLPVDVEIGAPYGHRDMPAAFKRPEANIASARWIGAFVDSAMVRTCRNGCVVQNSIRPSGHPTATDLASGPNAMTLAELKLGGVLSRALSSSVTQFR